MSSIITPLVNRLRQFNQGQLEAIAADAGVAKTLPRKLACGDRPNPTVQTIDPLIAYFNAIDRGVRVLPFEWSSTAPSKTHQANEDNIKVVANG